MTSSRNRGSSNVPVNSISRAFWAIAAPAIAAVISATAARAEDLSYFAVNIERTPKQAWPGYGVYLGDGFVLTAAHVVGKSLLSRPQVVAGQIHLPAQAVKEGTFDTNDLTLLRVDVSKLPGSMQLRRLRVCTSPIVPGQRVDVVIPGSIVSTHVVPPARLPDDVRERFPTAIADVVNTGNSGSGVFDPGRSCLVGIVSRKITRVYSHSNIGGQAQHSEDIAKYFVPPSTILSFLPSEARF